MLPFCLLISPLLDSKQRFRRPNREEEQEKTALGIEIEIGEGAKPSVGGPLPRRKVFEHISKSRLLPKVMEALSPARLYRRYQAKLARAIFT